MTRRNAIVTGRLILIAILTMIRWAVFEPLYFVFVIFYTIAEIGITEVKGFINRALQANEQLLNDESIKARK